MLTASTAECAQNEVLFQNKVVVDVIRGPVILKQTGPNLMNITC